MKKDVEDGKAIAHILVGWDLEDKLRVIEDNDWGADSHGFQWNGEPMKFTLKHPLEHHPDYQEKPVNNVIQFPDKTKEHKLMRQ